MKPPDIVNAIVAKKDMVMYALKRSGKNTIKYEIAVAPTTKSR
jgi:hypothetical protein